MSYTSTPSTPAQTRTTPTDITRFQLECLRILADDPRYGLAIKRELEARYGEEVNHGRLYPNLDRLVEAGLVAKSELDKRTNQYELTDDGERLVDEDILQALIDRGHLSDDATVGDLRTLTEAGR